ncbi:ElyC/SanA/YdcF family protein [Selenomonas ruminantium]|uniref:ElyC/SanA/YdcF family protein n=1 Tax=Selenomonas ruminantium TaxID=971 RepID=UPI00041EBB3E|nr:ElyC/SanA/YdcF family protein [Selenomonas ruminantium]
MGQKEMAKIAEAVNILGNFCGPRDIDKLTTAALEDKYHIPRVDVAVLFGGSILAGGEVFAEIMKKQLAEKYIIVGGAGHTTETLQRKMAACLGRKVPSDACEAELFNEYLQEKHGLAADYLEKESTNCGNNITFLLSLLEKEKLPHDSVLMVQDATMQRRMEAGWRHHAGAGLVVNYAAYKVKVTGNEKGLAYEGVPAGMWDMDRYVELLMGDAQRLQDTPDGYGPKGKNFIAHVNMPFEVKEAFRYLQKFYGVRKANPAYAKP